MKKLLAMILAVVLMLTFAACGSGYDWEDDIKEYESLMEEALEATKNMDYSKLQSLSEKGESLSSKLEKIEKEVQGEEAEAFQKAKEDMKQRIIAKYPEAAEMLSE